MKFCYFLSVSLLFLHLIRQVDDAVLDQWRTMILSCPVMITLMDGGPDQLFWQAFKKRQQVVANYEACRRTARQLAYEVASLKAQKEAESGEILSIKDLSDMFASHQSDMAVSSKRTDMADGFVKDCIFVFEKMLSDPVCNACLDILEEKYGLSSPLNSLQKMRVIIEKSESTPTRQGHMDGGFNHDNSGITFQHVNILT